jgi:hypothetical protein
MEDEHTFLRVDPELPDGAVDDEVPDAVYEERPVVLGLHRNEVPWSENGRREIDSLTRTLTRKFIQDVQCTERILLRAQQSQGFMQPIKNEFVFVLLQSIRTLVQLSMQVV